MISAVLGTVTLGLIANGMNLLGVSPLRAALTGVLLLGHDQPSTSPDNRRLRPVVAEPSLHTWGFRLKRARAAVCCRSRFPTSAPSFWVVCAGLARARAAAALSFDADPQAGRAARPSRSSDNPCASGCFHWTCRSAASRWWSATSSPAATSSSLSRRYDRALPCLWRSPLGALNAFFIARLRASSVIVDARDGSGAERRGDGVQSISSFPGRSLQDFIKYLGQIPKLGSYHWPLVWLGVLIPIAIFLRASVFGRYIDAIGANPRASWASAFPTCGWCSRRNPVQPVRRS